jgi:aconitate hydratase 2/2-methylisocitrate dehydratase
MAGEVYKYLNFDQMDAFRDAEKAAKENIIPTINVA